MLDRWRVWRAKCRLTAPMWRPPTGCFFARQLLFPELAAVEAAGGPALAPYAGLASVWHEYAGRCLPVYPPFLTTLTHVRRLPLRSALDLACGAGTLTERLADGVPDVVGADASRAMLAAARGRCGGRPGVRLAAADFRRLPPGRPFDAVVCALNTLN
jgi:SAM-dependent methyltransferase